LRSALKRVQGFCPHVTQGLWAEHDPEKHTLGRNPAVRSGFPKKIMLNEA
jgi:hypothetical protein